MEIFIKLKAELALLLLSQNFVDTCKQHKIVVRCTIGVSVQCVCITSMLTGILAA